MLIVARKGRVGKRSAAEQKTKPQLPTWLHGLPSVQSNREVRSSQSQTRAKKKLKTTFALHRMKRKRRCTST